jgi:hypothetical protein
VGLYGVAGNGPVPNDAALAMLKTEKKLNGMLRLADL